MSNLKSWEFGRIDLEDGNKIYGLVKGFSRGDYGKGGNVHIVSYDFGFATSLIVEDVTPDPFNWPSANNPKNPGVQIPNKEFLEHLKQRRDSMNEKLKSKDLIAACWATRQHCVDGIIKNLEKNIEHINHWELTKGTSAKTGVYVICPTHYSPEVYPDRCDKDPSNVPLQGLIVKPRASPSGIAKALKLLGINFKKGPEVWTKGIDLFAYEIPENATEFVKNPARLEYTFQ